MPSSTLKNPSISELDKSSHRTDTKQENADVNTKRLEQNFKSVSVQIFDLLSMAVDDGVLTAKDRKEYMEGISMKNMEAGGAITLQKKNEWLEDHIKKYAHEFIKIARKAINKFLDDIAKAEQNGWISAKSAERWYQRLYERSSSISDTKDFLESFNEKYMANWGNLANKKDELLKKKVKLKLTAKQIPELSAVEDKNFDELSYSEKATAVHLALAAIGIYEKKDIAIKNLKPLAISTLQLATKSPKALRDDQAAEWMESLFNRNRSATEIQKIISGTLTKYIHNWNRYRLRFDSVFHRMENEGIPPGTEKMNEKTYLNLSWDKKKSYVEESEYALNLLKKGFSDKPIDKMKLEIRSLIAQKDWSGAKAIIQNAKQLAEGEDVCELASMENTIRLSTASDTTEPEPEQPATKTLQDLRETLQEVPSSVRGLYIQALQAGPQVFSSLSTYMYNRVWCWDNGYLNHEIESGLSRSAKPETQDIVENGHRPYGLENIDLDSVDETKKAEAMRPYGSTWAPTVLHLDASNGSSCGTLINELRGKVEARDYWSSLILKNISYEKQRELVTSVNYRLKSGIRKLHAAGHGFSLTGDVHPASQKQSPALTATSYVQSA